MKPISLTKTMPWLLGASAVFTLAFSQNVSANTNGNQQATSIKQVNKTNATQANTNNLNLRMLYLNTSAKATLLNPGAKSATNDGLPDSYNHNNVNAYLADSGGATSGDNETFDYKVQYTLGDPKPFNDSSLKPSQTLANAAQFGYASVKRNHWKTSSEAKNSLSYTPEENFQNDPQVDLGNGVKAYKIVSTLRPDVEYQYNLTLYQGKYQITFNAISNSQDDANLWETMVKAAKPTVSDLKSAKLPKTDSHGTINFQVSSNPDLNALDQASTSDIEWQEGNQVYTSYATNADFNFGINPVSTNLKMVESIK